MIIQNNPRCILPVLLLGILSGALSALEVPQLTGRINDNADILSPSAESEIQAYLAAVEQKSGVQIALLTIASLEGDSLEGYSLRVAEKWALGQKGKDNGVLLLVAMAEKKIRIEVGYGLEAVLTDAVSGTIIRNIIVPYFKKGQYGNGVAAGLKTIGDVTSGEVSVKQIQSSSSGRTRGSTSPIFFLFFIMAFLLSGMGGVRRGRRRGMSFFPALFWGMFLSQGMRGSSRSSGSFGGGFSGGGFSGGFGGGGGGFGGGGASGGW